MNNFNFHNIPEPMHAPVLRRSHKAYCIYCHCITNVVNTNMRKNRICEFCKEKRMAYKIINRCCFRYLARRYRSFTPIICENKISENIDYLHVSQMISEYF